MNLFVVLAALANVLVLAMTVRRLVTQPRAWGPLQLALHRYRRSPFRDRGFFWVTLVMAAVCPLGAAAAFLWAPENTISLLTLGTFSALIAQLSRLGTLEGIYEKGWLVQGIFRQGAQGIGLRTIEDRKVTFVAGTDLVVRYLPRAEDADRLRALATRDPA